MTTITGTAAGVPYTALPPAGGGPAPLLVTWHMLDAPRSDAAFAAALPLAGVPAWRVHLGMPMCGARMVNGTLDAALTLIAEDVVLSFLAPIVDQAVAEFPAALTALRSQLPITDAPISLLGASLGGMVALCVLAAPPTPVAAAVLINPAIRLHSVVPLFPGTYPWTPQAQATATRLDLRTSGASIDTPLLIVSGADDHPTFRTDAATLADTLARGQVVTVPGLAHPLADEPGILPAPQLPHAKAVDTVLTEWFRIRT